MPRNTLRGLIAGVVLVLGATGTPDLADSASARPIVDPTTYVLHGTGMFSKAMATVTVSRLPGNRFQLVVTATQLPPSAILNVRFARHAYVAWLVNGKVMHGPLRMAAMGLSSSGGLGTYAGQGIVAIGSFTLVIITAEPRAQAYMPIMPVLTVLTSAGNQM